jgi:hypothetical protein
MAEGGFGYVLKTRMKVHLIRRYERPFSGNLTLAHLFPRDFPEKPSEIKAVSEIFISLGCTHNPACLCLHIMKWFEHARPRYFFGIERAADHSGV